jgi:hypothetical protein
MRKTLRFEVLAALVCLAGVALLVATESLAQRRGGRGGRHITRSGPASHGSYGRNVESRRNEAPRPSAPQSREDRVRAADRDNSPARDLDRDAYRDDLQNNNQQNNQQNNRDRGQIRNNNRDRNQDRDDDREPDRDRDDRRDDDYDRDRDPDRDRDRHDVARRHRAWYRGDQISYIEYREYNCDEDAVVVDGDKYYRCEGSWFVRTYYGGEMVYTVTESPR